MERRQELVSSYFYVQQPSGTGTGSPCCYTCASDGAGSSSLTRQQTISRRFNRNPLITLRTCRSIMLAFLHLVTVYRIPRTSSDSALTEFAQVGPIVAGVLGGLSAILLILLIYRIRRRYKMRRQLAIASHNQQDRAKPRWFRLFGKRERTPSSYWDEYLWEKDLEAFPQPPKNESRPTQSSLAFTDRPLPTVPAIARAPGPQDESYGAPIFFPSRQPTSSDISSTTSSLNVSNPSRTKLRVRPDPMLIQGIQQLETQRRQDFAGFTPARRSYFDMPPPMPALTNDRPPLPPGLGASHGRSQSDPAPATPTDMPRIRPRSRSDANGSMRQPTEATLPRRRRHQSFSAPVISPETISVVSEADTTPSTQLINRRELAFSLYETQEAVAALEDQLSASTIDIPPLTAHSRFFSSTTDDTEHLHTEVEILRREVQRLQNLLLAPRPHDTSGTSSESGQDGERSPPPPVYST
jgi:hypothetical protein